MRGLCAAAAAVLSCILAVAAAEEAPMVRAAKLAEGGELPAAAALYEETLAQNADPVTAPVVHHEVAVVYARMGKMDDALAHFQAAIREGDPTFATQARYNMAFALQQAGRDAEATSEFARCTEDQPDFRPAHIKAAYLYYQRNDYPNTLHHLNAAVKLDGSDPQVYMYMGDTLNNLKRFSEAETAYKRALRLAPGVPELVTSLADCQQNMKKEREAVKNYRKALDRLERQLPRSPKAIRRLLARGPASGPEAEAAGVLLRALVGLWTAASSLCDWRDTDATLRRIRQLSGVELDLGRPTTLSPYHALFSPLPAASRRRVAGSWAAQHLRIAKQHVGAVPTPPPPRDEGSTPLRLGYVSRRFEDYAGTQLMLGLFAAHNRSRVQVLSFAHGPDDGSRERRVVQSTSDAFVDISAPSDPDAADAVKNASVDVLVDYDGAHDFNNMGMLARRPALVQATFLGFPGTSGSQRWSARVRKRWRERQRAKDGSAEAWATPWPAFDHVVSDRVVAPVERAGEEVAESLLVLPHSYQPQDPAREVDASDAGTALHELRKRAGLPETAFVFACFVRPQKLDSSMFAAWTAALLRTPGSTLWLLSGSPGVERNLRAQASARGVHPSRLVFAGRAPKARHLARHRLADVMLDARWYNSHTTASDALWAGVPLLTLEGEAFSSRVASSLLRTAGLSPLVATSLEDYSEQAASLAADHGRRALTAGAYWVNRTLSTPLFNATHFTTSLEQGLRAAWERAASGNAPMHVVTAQQA